MERDRKPDIHVKKPGNLQERPLPVMRGLINKGERVAARVNELKGIYEASNKVRLRAVETHIGNATAIAYRGEPFVNDILYANRELHGLIPTMKTLYEKRAITGTNPSLLEENDLFVQKFKGLSLMDIENMEVDPKTHELAPEDIRKINRMFRPSGIFRIGRDKSQTYVLEHLIYFASQQWIHPEIGVPRSLKKFQNNITAYFDYYTSFLTDFNRDSINESIMLMMLTLGAPYLLTAVASYAPAKLNITPSSAIKLYKQREELAEYYLLKGTWKRLEKLFFPVFKQAYRSDALPKDLEQYQHYNEEVDYAAANILQSYMQKTVSVEEQLKKSDEVKTVLEQWNKHKKDVIRELMQHPKKRLEYQTSQDHPGEKITMVKNRGTFVFVIRFPDNIHLTLEIDKTGKLFGIPPSLLKAYPHVEDTLMVDILSPLLKKHKTKETPSNTSQINASLYLVPIEPEIPEDLIQEKKEQVIKPPKRKRLLQTLTIFKPDPLPPIAAQLPKAERFVAYSEDQIKEQLGPQVSRQQFVVDQILRAINNFEYGYTHGKMLKGSGRIIRIRTGNYRILIEILGGGNYSIREIVHRKDAPY